MSKICAICKTVNPSDSKLCSECSAPLSPEEDSPDAKTMTLKPDRKDFGVGEVVSGRYRLLEELGKGGMGVVYKAEQIEPIKRTVALKIIKLGMDTHSVIARFEAEEQALAVMDHPNIAKVFDAGATEKGRPYFVMELVHGVPINDYCDRHNLTTAERLALFIPVCQAVQHAHQKGVIHRDLKPSNVIVTIQGDSPVPKIIDFGIAKATGHRLAEQTLFTEQGLLIGTPEYMSPEQAEMSGLDIDTRTDIYSLGVMLYELLAGVLPFDSRTLREAGFGEIQRIIREEDPPKASTRLGRLGDTQTSIAKHRNTDASSLVRQLKGDLDWITMKAMAKDRTHRYAAASELVVDIQRYLANEPVSASPPSTAYRMKKYIRRHKTGVAAASLIVLAMLIGIAGTSLGFLRARRAERVARDEARTARQMSDFLVGLFKVSDPSEARGNTVTAREILNTGARKIDQELEGQPLVRSRLMNTMGEVYTSLGLYNDALRLLEKALAIREKSLSPDDPIVAESLSNLGNLFWRRGDYPKAKSLHERALRIREAKFGAEHLTVAKSLHNLGNLLHSSGKYEEAKPRYERALKIFEKTSGPDSTDAAMTLNSLGLLIYNMGKYDEAQPLCERSLAIYEKVLGPEHPDLTNPLHNLGMVLRAKDEIEKARACFERCVTIEEKVYGPEHPHLATTLSSLAILYATTANFEKAKPIFERVLAINQKALGPEHPEVGSDLTNLGILNAQMGNFEAARPLLERGLAIKEKALGSEHPKVANDINNLAALLFDMGKPEEVPPLLERALKIREKALGPEHPDVALSLNDLANALAATKDYSRARPLFERALAIQEKAVGPENAAVAAVLNGLAELLLDLGQYEESRLKYERALAINEKALGADHPEVAVSLAGLGELLYRAGKSGQAKPLLERALKIREEKLGPDHPYVANTLESLAKVLRKLGEGNKAKALEERARAIRK